MRFHFLYYNLMYDGKDEGLNYISWRTVLLKSNQIIEIREEEILE